MGAVAAQQRLGSQPVAHFRHFRVLQDFGECVAAFGFAAAVHQGEQVQVVVAEYGLHAAFVFHTELQALQRLRTAVYDVAGEPECVCAVIETDV